MKARKPGSAASCHRSPWSWALVTLASAGTTVCHAQAQEEQTLDAVVVSVSRSEQRSFDTPAAISSAERQAILAGGPQVNLSESLNRVPGLTVLDRENYAQDLQVSIRGFGSHSTFGIRGIRLFVDGIPATTPDGQSQGSAISLASTDRIEVLRGPLALMYGNTSGGVIQAWTRDPSPTPETQYGYYTGSYGLRRSDTQVSGTVGNVGLLLDYSTFDTNGYRDHSAAERNQYNGKIAFGPDARTRVNVIFNQFDMPYAQDPTGLTAAQLAQNPTQAGTNTVLRNAMKKVSQEQVGSTLVHELDDQSSLTAQVYIGSRSNLQFQAGSNPSTTSPTGSWVSLSRDYYGLGLQYNQRTQMGTLPVAWVSGYNMDHSGEQRVNGLSTLGQISSTTSSAANLATNNDFFTQATAELSDRFSLTAGLRYNMVLLENDSYTSATGSGSQSYEVATPVLGLTWHASDAVNVYANYGHGFETPTMDELAYVQGGTPPTPTAVATFNSALRASHSDQYEVGTKWAPDPWSRIDATLFQVWTTDELVIQNSIGGQTIYTNAPGTQRTGVELSAAQVWGLHWRGTLSATSVDAHYTQAFNTGTQSVASGNRMPGIPQFYVFSELLWTQDELPSARRVSPRGLQVGAEMVNAGRLYANDDNTASADGYTVFNLRASEGWQVGHAFVSIYGRLNNVAGQQYVGSVIVDQSAGGYYEPAPGFNWSLGARLAFAL